jgi:cellulose synthase/poly-beta-1,6-N-acetylglucosamine synthase-like glycosyltransferase
MIADTPGSPIREARHCFAPPLFFWSIFLIIGGLSVMLLGTFLPMVFAWAAMAPLPGVNWLSRAGSAAVLLAILMAAADLKFILPRRRIPGRRAEGDGYAVSGVTVALTAYNDEDSIGPAVADFLAQPLVKRVIVVSNNSRDRTMERARDAGAIVHNESLPGYGRCVFRCLSEAALFADTECVALCEGDMTFRARDLSKMLAYLPHADIVNGTRIVEQLRSYRTQLTTFMYYGNFFVGKLLEAKHFGRGTFTDVGTTFKIVRTEALRELLPALNPGINLEFNAHFLDSALASGVLLVECPITFHARVGTSKGGNVNDFRALKVGGRMILGLMFGWDRTSHS